MSQNISLPEPQDYFLGVSSRSPLLADNILLFSRYSMNDLKGKAQASSPHRRYVLCICLEGRGSVFIDHHRIDLKPHQAVLIPPFRFHYYDFIEAPDLHWLFITFDTESQSPSLISAPAAISLKKPLRKRLVKLCELFNDLSSGHDRHRFLILANAFIYDLLSDSKKKDHSQKIKLKPRHSSWPQKIQKALEQFPDMTISSLAHHLGLSEGHLRNEFRNSQNMALNDYVSHFRMHLAIKLLHDNETSLIEIAHYLGFSSQASFSRFFKRMTQSSPAKFRRETLDQ